MLLPMPQGCRSCCHFLSHKDIAPEGVCELTLEWVTWTDGCSKHNPRREDGTYLIERECSQCERANLFAAGYDMDLYCPICGARGGNR